MSQVEFFVKSCPDTLPLSDFIKTCIENLLFVSVKRGDPVFHFGTPFNLPLKQFSKQVTKEISSLSFSLEWLQCTCPKTRKKLRRNMSRDNILRWSGSNWNLRKCKVVWCARLALVWRMKRLFVIYSRRPRRTRRSTKVICSFSSQAVPPSI